MEVDRDLEVLPVAEAACHVADPLDLRVQALARRIRDSVLDVGEHVLQPALDHLRLLDHGREPRVSGPPVPAVEERPRCADVAVVPQLGGRLLEGPCASHPEVAVAQWRELPLRLRIEVRRVAQPGVFRTCRDK